MNGRIILINWKKKSKDERYGIQRLFDESLFIKITESPSNEDTLKQKQKTKRKLKQKQNNHKNLIQWKKEQKYNIETDKFWNLILTN